MAEYVAGIDVSKWQGVIDWAAVKQQGIVWACARMGIGTTYKDDYWFDNLANARANGIVIGGYYVPTFDTGGAGGLINNLEECLEDLIAPPDFLVNDVEKFNGETNKRKINDHIYQISNYMRDIVSDRVLQYSSKSIWDAKVGSRPMGIDTDWDDSYAQASDYRLWAAHYRALAGQNWQYYLYPSNMPSLPIAWVPSSTEDRGKYLGWKIWQVAESATGFQGIQSKEVDINLWKADDFYGMFPGAIPGDPTPDPEPEPTPDPEPEPTPDPTEEEIIGYLKVYKPGA